ncbi:OVARIAN TUMOR DOMAIN-containing deubiquitinating enzyme 9-like [Salvia splendens]|uniref:OVARIAN TUMOR DOMAIN-containing deubiquitinating enzyme 9-like n=1 Tax=Salvia splendens TaxID=180675 RepID=UPI001C274C0B|nr:OVARIAN TUMOR DOMAIN-containing deubiquitinating enzyme 9-like [Salvia splendens]
MTMLRRPSYAAILANGPSAYNAKIPTKGASTYDAEIPANDASVYDYHVPKINEEVASSDDVSSDHERLLNRLELYELVEHKIMGDGNCQFRSLSDQIYGTSDYHGLVREEIVHQLKSQPEFYANFVPMAYGDYLKKMSRNGEWGDNVTLQAAADCYGVKIFVVTSYKVTCYIEILPKVVKSDTTILLSFRAEVHYNSIYPCQDGKNKKKSWCM